MLRHTLADGYVHLYTLFVSTAAPYYFYDNLSCSAGGDLSKAISTLHQVPGYERVEELHNHFYCYISCR